MNHRFRAGSHIRRRPEFQHVYETGARLHGRLMTVFVLPRSDARTRLGIAATKKLGGAVVRNRAKRLVREVFRQHANPPGVDIVVVPRPALLNAPVGAIESDYASCVDRRARRTRSAS
jgi:ribonuclease P protein component